MEELSSEEADLFARSIKKVKKNDNAEGMGDEIMADGMFGAQPIDAYQGEQGLVSFRDKLLSTPTDTHSVKEGEVVLSDLDGSSSDDSGSSDTDSSSDEEGGDRLDIPVLEFSQEEYEQWCRPWKLTLLVRLMGKSVGVTFMRNRLEKLWQRKGSGPSQIIDLENGYFAVSFTNQDDYLYAFQEGPWLIADHYLIVQRWRPNFDPYNGNEVTKIAAWVRVPNLPLEFYNAKCLCRVGNLIGKTLKIDPTTSITSRGKFARICVEINLKKKLVPHVVIRGRCYGVEYEGLHLICFHCGKYGHQKGQCTDLKVQSKSIDEENHNDVVGDSTVPTQEGLEVAKAPPAGGGTNLEQDDGKGREDEMGKSEIYGPWMLPKRNNQRRNLASRKYAVNANHGHKINGGFTKGTNQSRFDVLRDLEVNKDNLQPHVSDVNVISGRNERASQVGIRIGSEAHVVVRPKVISSQAGGGQSRGGNKKANSSYDGRKNMRDSFVNPVFEKEQVNEMLNNYGGPSGLGSNTLNKSSHPHARLFSGTTSHKDNVDRPSKPPDLNLEFMDVGEENFGETTEDMQMHEVDKSGDKASEIIKKLGFDGIERVDAVGFAGGIWCLWRQECVSISILWKHPQFIHLKVIKGGQEWLFTVVYGSPTVSTWRQLWELLTTIGSNSSIPWAVAGDFNAFLFEYEKHGGSSGGIRPDQGFRDWVDSCDMIDMGFTGTSTHDLGKYLGVPIIHGRRTKHTYSFIVDKVQNRLSSWKSSSLSLAGRVTLVQSVTSAIPSYVMQTVELPVTVCNEIEKANRKFIWGGNENRRKVHLVGWDKLCNPKSSGGLGLRHLKVQNSTFMSKLGMSVGSNPSRLWRGIVKNWSSVDKGVRWRIGNGNRSKFWSDEWIPNYGKLCHMAVGPLTESELNASVSSFVSPSGGWDWRRFESLLPNDACLRIAAIGPPCANSVEDTPIWKHSKDGKFSIKSCYNAVNGVRYGTRGNIWNSVWKLSVPQRVRSFMWLCAHDKLLTNVERCRRQMSDSAVCDRCGSNCEDLIHALRDCSVIKDVWLRLVKPCYWPEFFHAGLSDWISLNLHRNLGVFDIPWKEIFATTCWSAWKWRNEHVFQQCDPKLSDPVFSILHKVRSASEASRALVNSGKDPPSRTHSLVKWQSPEMGWFKVNVDGACSREALERASCGGVVRDYMGRFIYGFSKNLGSCDALAAELWGVILGLNMAWELGIKKVVVEVDSTSAHQLVYAQNQEFHPYAALVTDIHLLLARNWEVSVCHVLREANCVADFFAKCAPRDTMDLLKFDQPPLEACDLMMRMGLVC
ncbi:putative RNA-directed DNA polymerase [Senna tora]|uniref:Putative RNA-directed DNA polymerase n=1 Tax=Senna tora TaxID=362788 RepID=A0A835CKE6_9FABA|nr:putative RNA-directed DNA polymerase [Senna tora]